MQWELTLVKALSWVVSSLSGGSLCSSTSSDSVRFWTQLRQRYIVSSLSKPGKSRRRDKQQFRGSDAEPWKIHPDP